MPARTPAAIVLGRDLRAARSAARRTQASVGREAGISQPEVSKMELGRGGNVDLDTWVAAGDSVDVWLAFSGSSAERARAGHRLIAHTAVRGGWV